MGACCRNGPRGGAQMGALSIEQVLAEETDAIFGENWHNQLVRPIAGQDNEARRVRMNADERDGTDLPPSEAERREKFYRALNRLNRAALCCSGGGIRSATFCLGVIQAARRLRRHAPGAQTTAQCGRRQAPRMPRRPTPRRRLPRRQSSTRSSKSSPRIPCSAASTISRPCPAAAMSVRGCHRGAPATILRP